MSEPQTNTTSTRGQAVFAHLAVVALSFFVSLMLMRRVGLMPGEALDCLAAGFLLVHGLAAFVAILLRRVTVLSCFAVFAAAFLPCGGCLGIEQTRDAIQHRYYYPYDRFRDNLGPVPGSVTNLRFVTMEEGIRPDLMFQFDIAPADLDAILEQKQLKRVDPAAMLNPKDFFQYPYYMPIGGDFHLFQGTGEYGNVLTIKTNETHSHAIFRKESSNFYGDRSWETRPAIQIQMDNDALERLRRKYAK